MRHASTKQVFAYWDVLRGDRAAPERGEIEPGALRHVLTDTFVLENEAIGPLFRLAGTRLCALFGSELKGRPFVALWPDIAGQIEMRRLTETVMNDAAGAVAGVLGRTTGGQETHLELLLLPLRYRGRTHARLLGALSPNVTPPWLGIDQIDELKLLSVRMIFGNGRKAQDGEAQLPTHAPGLGRPRLVVLEGGLVERRRVTPL
jgi:hypothetical protein